MTAIRRFRPQDAAGTHDVFVTAVLVGAAARYTRAELDAWIPDPAMPEDWAGWLDGHFTAVADEDGRITGFMMLEADGYLNMAFVRPDRMGTGLADRLLAAILEEARRLGLPRLTCIASRHAQSFFARHGWRLAPELVLIGGRDMRDWPEPDPVARSMMLDRVTQT
jgi:putative acetyltransferase